MVRQPTHPYDPDKYTKPDKPIYPLDPDTYGTRPPPRPKPTPRNMALNLDKPLEPVEPINFNNSKWHNGNTRGNPNVPIIPNEKTVQRMIDKSIEPIETRVDNLENKLYQTVATNTSTNYYRQKRKPEDTVNRIFLLDDKNIVYYIFNAVEDVATPTLIGWRLWRPYELKTLDAYETITISDGEVIYKDTIFEITTEEIENCAIATIKENKL